jgi:RNA polymerase sigma-70 factor (ECF subfamily)
VDELPELAALYAGCYRRLVAQLAAALGDLAEAEDAVQEAFVRAAARWPTVRRADNPEAWLRTVALNVARSRWRRLRVARKFAPRLVETLPGAEPGLDRAALVAALRKLPQAQREVLVLHHMADLPVADIAETLRLPEGTVKARLSRGRAALAVLLTDVAEVAGA